jgi:threonylcarbamoyladenosine tRNA methylthiotransferase MtaB
MFEEAGYIPVNFEMGADIYIINTCSVTDFADKKCKKIVRLAQSYHADARIIMTGCYAQLKPEEISNIPGVDLVIGAAEKFNILSHVEQLIDDVESEKILAGKIAEVNQFISSFSLGDRTRSFLKVQDGCDYKCSFCTIPMARGKSRSDTIDHVIQKAKEIESKGVKEIVLTGINLGDFGNGTEVIEGIKPKKNHLFIDLIREMDAQLDIPRIRISSIEPNLCTNEIIDFVAASNRFMPHFHMPLQSGNNKQLKAMRRRYKRELYADRVLQIKNLMPHACIGVDVIVGFPNESWEDFLESYRFINELEVSYLHAFTYSERANTLAAEMDLAVEMGERKKRNKMLRILSDKKKAHFYEKHIGDQRPVLFEQSQKPDRITGFTDNYIKIDMPKNDYLVNQLKSVELLKLRADLRMESILSDFVPEL